jgi:hypothetical protein
VADSENVHCCRCSDRICWRLVSNERLEALDVRLAAFVSEEEEYTRDGWLGLKAAYTLCSHLCPLCESRSPVGHWHPSARGYAQPPA